MITANMKEFRELHRDIAKQPQPIIRELREEIRRSCMAIAHHYRRKAKEHFITGEFFNSIEATSSDGWMTGEVGSTVLQSIFLEVGTKAHKITPKTAKMLVFFWEKVGMQMFLKQVNHPGTPAFNLLLKAYMEVMEPFIKFLNRLSKGLEGVKL